MSFTEKRKKDGYHTILIPKTKDSPHSIGILQSSNKGFYKLINEPVPLKGGVSYYEYIWHTEDGACDDCEALDGEAFTNPEDIPDSLHPNCRCWVEVVEKDDTEGNNNSNENSEPQDFWDKIQEFLDSINEAIGNANSNIEEIQELEKQISQECEQIINSNKNSIDTKNIEKLQEKYKEVQEIKDILDKNSSEKLQELYKILDKYELNDLKNELEQNISNVMSKMNGAKAIILYLGQKVMEPQLGNNYNSFFYNITHNVVGPETAGLLDLAHHTMNNPEYIKDAIMLKNYNDPNIVDIRSKVINKVNEQFGKYNFDPKNIPGYRFPENSAQSVRISQNPDLLNYISQHFEQIINNNVNSISFPLHKLQISLSDLKFAIGRADILNGYIDENGNLHITILDTYDFNKDWNPLIRAGEAQMKKGNLEPYFDVFDVIITKEKLEEILPDYVKKDIQ